MRSREIMQIVSAEDIVSFINNSYENRSKQVKRIKSFIRDDILSGSRTTVYKDDTSDLCVVVHRGTKTIGDVGTDVGASLGLTKFSSRFQCALTTQKIAVRKYGKTNILTLGHSLGGKIAEMVGSKGKLTITYNKPVTMDAFFVKQSYKRQKDIRSRFDVPSLFNTGTQVIQIDSSLNPLKAHNTNTLSDSAAKLNAQLLLRSNSDSSGSISSESGESG